MPKRTNDLSGDTPTRGSYIPTIIHVDTLPPLEAQDDDRPVHISDANRTRSGTRIPRGRPDEAGPLFATLGLALVRVIIWLIAGIGRLVIWVFRQLALGIGWLVNRFFRQRMSERITEIVGWGLLIAILVSSIGIVGRSQRWLDIWPFQASIASRHVAVVVATPVTTPLSATCLKPRIACGKVSTDIRGAPTISADKILSVLQSYNSPAATPDFANNLYDLGVKYGINPAYALAFFIEESSCGTQGVARVTHSLGNIRFSDSQSPVGYGGYDGYRKYDTWRDGAEDWYWVIRTFYVDRGASDINVITPTYAPSNDNNDPTQYARTVYSLVVQWGN